MSLLPSEGKERVPIMFKFCLHFDGNEFFFSFFEVWLLRSACDCKYGLSSEGQNDVGVRSRIGNVTLCSVCQMNSYRAPCRHDLCQPRGCVDNSVKRTRRGGHCKPNSDRLTSTHINRPIMLDTQVQTAF